MSRFVAVVCALVTLGATGAVSEGPPQVPAAVPCFERPGVVVYLHRLQDRILDHWVLPEDGLANRTVTLKLRIDTNGVLLGYELLSRTSPRLATSALQALAGAAPFEPMTDATACLAERAIVSEFSNPS